MQKITIIEPLFDNENLEEKIDEITALCDSAEGQVVGVISQLIKQVTPATFIGKGKAEEVKFEVLNNDSSLVVLSVT